MILAWFDKRKPRAALRKQFADDIDVFFDTISARNHWRECLTTCLEDEGAATFTMSGSSWRARPCGSGLAVSSVVPGWNFGWSKVLPDKLSYNILSWFGHYARQYVHRSNIAKVLMAAWERHNLVLHPFGNGFQFQRYNAEINPVTPSMLALADNQVALRWGRPVTRGQHYRSKWATRNTLDPGIHQAVFHFLRAQSLAAAGFELEAIAAFDCVMHSLQYMDWSWAEGNARRYRGDLCRALGMGAASADLAEHVYFLRNQFVAHAGGWRWWDAGEYFEGDLIESVSRMTARALRKAADLEPAHRVIDPEPNDWACWLLENLPMIWSAVWFRDA